MLYKPSIVLHSGTNYAVLAKPSGVVTRNFVSAVTNLLCVQFGLNAEAVCGDKKNSNLPAEVHRLDRGTSGCLIVGMTSGVRRSFSNRFLSHAIHKTYVAIVSGEVRGDDGTIDQPLTTVRTKNDFGYECSYTTVDPKEGKPSITHYRVLHRFADTSFVQFIPETGRTHQIRAHTASIGHPIMGDSQYGTPIEAPLCLHALRIEFPEGPKNMVTVQAPLPPHMSSFLQQRGLVFG